MKRKINIFLSFALCSFFLFTSLIQNVYAEDIHVNAISAIALDCDSKIVLYEKNQNPEFKLTCSIQVYLNSICYYQFLARLKSSYTKKMVHTDDFDENSQDWFEEETETNNTKIERLLKEFEILKVNGDKCYERLKLFYYDKLSMAEIASKLEFSNAVSARNQVNRCRGKLKLLLAL